MTDDTRQDSTAPEWWKEESREFHEDTDAAMDVVGIDANQGSTQATRRDLVTARETINRAIAGDDADLSAAAALLDGALQSLCPHDPAQWHTAPDSAGRMLTTCPACGVSWYEHEGQS